MKLLNEKCFTYDSDTQTYHFDFDQTKAPKKISSRMTPILLGLNKFQSNGYGILERLRMLEQEPDIDTWYKIRGALAEYFAEKEILKEFADDVLDSVKTKHFRTSQFKWSDQFHPDYKWGNDKYSGCVDIAITEPIEAKSVVEVKGKSVDGRKWVESAMGKHGDDFPYNDDEGLQGMQLSELSKVDNLFMAYVFFPPSIEEKIKTISSQFINVEDYTDDVIKEILELTLIKQSDLDYLFKYYEVNHSRIQGMMERAYENVQRAWKSGNIAKVLFSDEENEYLQRIWFKIDPNSPF